MPDPIASRPDMPGYGLAEPDAGKGLLPWSWARDLLVGTRDYWLATTRPAAVPHLMPVWGVWVDDLLWFSTGPRSVKARNLAAQPRCTIAVSGSDPLVVVEGSAAPCAAPSADRERLLALDSIYKAKYEYDLVTELGPVYRFVPRVAFGWTERDYPAVATRWTFGSPEP